jgi:hypothetical protein
MVEFKFKNNNVKKEVKKIEEVVKEKVVKEEVKVYKSKKPWFIWSEKEYNYNLTFEEKLELFLDESKEKLRALGLRKHTKSDSRISKEENSKRRKIALKKKNRQ